MSFLPKRLKRIAFYLHFVSLSLSLSLSRMESNSLPMRIHCSDRSAELLRSQAPEIKLESRGVINVKGKGDMETFWVADDVIGGQELDLSTEFIGKLKD